MNVAAMALVGPVTVVDANEGRWGEKLPVESFQIPAFMIPGRTI